MLFVIQLVDGPSCFREDHVAGLKLETSKQNETSAENGSIGIGDCDRQRYVHSILNVASMNKQQNTKEYSVQQS
jgi:hypothetical protein